LIDKPPPFDYCFDAMNTKDITKKIQHKVGAKEDGVWGNESATKTAESLGIDLDYKTEHSLWCPFAKMMIPKSQTRKDYPKGYPQGAVIHYTSGWQNQSLQDAIDFQVVQGYTYFVINERGEIAQNFPLNRSGYHAGESSHIKLGEWVSSDLVGIEITCAGLLDSDRKPWFSKSPVHSTDCREITSQDGNRQRGIYQKYTEAQEKSLVDLLRWLKENNPSVFDFDLVLGHDEVSPGRKQDPGGSLSKNMDDFRENLKG
jgi:N-acetyl-anhydromuramyl-L-alanine amidase AmpD